jgi:hypothetical protein
MGVIDPISRLSGGGGADGYNDVVQTYGLAGLADFQADIQLGDSRTQANAYDDLGSKIADRVDLSTDDGPPKIAQEVGNVADALGLNEAQETLLLQAANDALQAKADGTDGATPPD